MNALNCFLTLFLLGNAQIAHAKVIVGVTIHSYTNPNGTAYVETKTTRKCCDGPQRESCETGDTCDTYFDICIGSMKASWGCKGAFMKSEIFNNTNNITDAVELQATSDFWEPGMMIFIFIRDDDSHGKVQIHDHIDTLIDSLDFNPDGQELLSQVHDYDWEGKTHLSLSVKAWCAPDYYGDRCEVHCKGIQQIATCNRAGQLNCQYSDEILLEFKTNVSADQQQQLSREANSFVANEVCPVAGQPEVDYPQLDAASNTLSFTAFCGSRQIMALEFESLLQLKTDQALTAYFPAGIVRGPLIAPRNYGEHIVPNVYLGIEIESFNHPTGTSFNGNNVNGDRRCCDVPKKGNCGVETDKCDIHLSICIGKLVNAACIGAYVSSLTYDNTTSLDICGPTLLDLSNGKTFVSHPMIGAMRLTDNATSVDVAVQDSDMDGLSFDVIDQIRQNFTLNIGDNVTDAQETEVVLKNVVTLKLHILAWCAPGHSGPTCSPEKGTENCTLGWYGQDCDKQVDLCHPNPCGSGRCDVVFGVVNCTCPPGLQGPTCSDDVNECSKSVCQNNATCENKVGSFVCHCAPGWDGLICTDRSPVCYPSPCIHGTCLTSDDDSYTCNCERGWTGKNCSEKYVCDSSTCLHGRCYMSDCLCYDGFMGPKCFQDKDECRDKPCLNSGNCTNTIGSFVCACAAGFTGKVCENATSKCSTEFCKNGGTCVVDLTGNRRCTCPSGYSGSHCEQLDLCSTITCAHNFSCQQFLDDGDFYCMCDSHWSGKTCDVDVNECSKNVCQHSASCTNLPGSYACTCTNGWSGQNCENDIKECTNTTLCNHGYCVNSPGSFKCRCNEGFTGEFCQTKILHCQNVKCSSHGTCQDDLVDYLCACQAGWMGNICQEDVDECTLNYCGANQLNCTNFSGGYNCTCKPGWGGVNCSEDFDECVTHPCHGNGVCTNTKGSYTCDCHSGFTGSQCEVFINQCAFDKCLNGGTCHVTQNGTECICTDAWTGIKCETDVNECFTNPCKNFGTCSNTNGSFVCSCFRGWSGTTCESDVNECITTRCENNGVCSNLLGSFKCVCQLGWQGQFCEIKRLTSLSGKLFDMQFVQNISAAVQQQTISSLYKFIQNICGDQEVKIFIRSIVGSVLQFISTCGNSSLSESSIQTAFKNVPETEMEKLFPVPFTGIWQSQSGRTTQSPGSKSWIHDHWPVVAGCVGAAVIITVVVVIGCLRDRRLKLKQEQGFTNPIYSSDQTSYS